MANNQTQNRNEIPKIPGFGAGPRNTLRGPVVKAKNTKGTVERIWNYLQHSKGKLVIVFFLVILSALFMLMGPFLIGKAIDKYIIPGDFKGLFSIAMLMIVVYICGTIATWIQNYIMVGVSQETVNEIRKDLFSKLQDLPLKYFDSKPHGELMSRLTNDVENISNTLNTSVTQIISSVVTVMGTLIAMLILSPALTIVTIIIVPIMLILTGKISKNTLKYFTQQQIALGKLNGLIEETISGQKVVKVFCREEKGISEFEKTNKELREVGIKAQSFSGVIGPVMNFLNNISFAIVAATGGYLALENIVTVGVIASFINYSKQFTRPINELANQFNLIQSAIAGAERVFEVMDECPELIDDEKAIILKDIEGKVKFENVYFSYKQHNPILKNINLDVKSGETIALVGPTGAGKTTIVNLLTRFYDIDYGSILVDGEDIRNVNRHSLRASLGIVLQDTYLFSESVMDNIRYGRLNATDEDVIKAAKLANANHFIKRLPEGYNTILSEDGGNLSQGQRQLLAIARAILKDPAILILDEATSSVDTRTEVHIQQAMLNLMKGRTSFVIAHRLSTIRDADKIVVINGGEIIESGNHEELLEIEGFYYNLYMSQFTNANQKGTVAGYCP